MGRIVIKMQADQAGETRFCLEPAPGMVHPASGTLYPLPLGPNSSAFFSMQQGMLVPDIVRQAGILLFQNLALHPAINVGITSVLTQTIPHPIYIYLQSDFAEALPWECLCNPTTGEFLTLDKRWPVGRIVDSSNLAIERAVEPPIRLTAVLAAAGATSSCYGSACYEWEALYQAVSAMSFKIDLQVIVSDNTLLQHIQNLAPPAHVQIKQAILVPSQQYVQDLFNAIRGFEPNILHFFCHGSAHPSPHLELASNFDYEATLLRGSIEIDASQLWQETDLERHIWLVTLNCCQGATPVADTHSMARDLVSQGFPVVIGMRETVTSVDAHAFCEAFYRSFLAEIGGLLQLGQTAVEIEWAKLLHAPRVQLRNQNARGRPRTKAEGEAKEWTLPALYMGNRGFKLRGPSTNLSLTREQKVDRQVQLDVLAEQRNETVLDINTIQLINTFDRRIREIEEELYPS